MANRKQAPEDVVQRHTAVVTEAADRRDEAAVALMDAEEGLRLAIREAFEAGITAGPIKAASRLSESRLYQIRDGRRH